MADFEAKNRTFALSLVAAYSSNLDYFHHVLNVLGSYTGDSTQTLHTMGTNLFQQNNLNIKMSDVSLCSTVNANIVSEITCGNQSDIKIDHSSKTDRPLRRSSRVVAVPLGGYTNDLPEDVLVQVKQLKTQLQTPETSDLMKRKNPSKFLNNNSITIKRRNLTTKQTNYLINAFKTISNMSDKLNVTKVITDRANQFFKTVSEGKKLRGHSFDAIAAACMYIACRQEGMPGTFKDIVAVSTVSSMKTVTKCYKLILKVHDTYVDLITTADYISRFCETLSLDRDIEKAADFIAKAAKDLDIVVGKSPRSVAAASIYMASQASGEKKTLCEIADIARVYFKTIRHCYKLMRPRANEIFSSDFKFERRIQYLPRTLFRVFMTSSLTSASNISPSRNFVCS